MCIQPTDDVTAKEAGVVSHGRTLRTYSNTCLMVFGMDTSVLAPTPSPWYSIGSLGENSLFLGPNYPMMVKGHPAVVDTTLLPFMRSNCIYTSTLRWFPTLLLIYVASAWMISPALLSILTIAGPYREPMVQSTRFQRRGLVELKFISLLVICCVMKTSVFTRMFCWK